MSKSKNSRKDRASASSRPAAGRTPSGSTSEFPTVSAKWLLTAGALTLVAALVCAWGTLCILFWQGCWQLLYHPASAATRTPASVNLPFESIGFATDPAGEPQLRGWWIPASSPPRYTAIYFHGADGNLGDNVDSLAQLHAAGLSILAFDYRGYGQSRFEHPGEARWREDADSALAYLTGTRHVPASAIVLVGKDLGANLALEVAAAHPDLAGVLVEQPLESPAAAGDLLIPSLWFYWTPERNAASEQDRPEAYDKVPARKTLVWLTNSPD